VNRVMVRYRVKPDQAAANGDLVRAVYDELNSSRPSGLKYATFQLEDGVSFVHIAETEDGSNPLTEMKAFREFQKDIRDHCDNAPVVSELQVIGAYRHFGDGDGPSS
jgi:hypothetical protein